MITPCSHDCSDFTDDPQDDYGCCGPIPVRKDCGAPTLPESECGDTAALEFDEDTEEFVATVTAFTNECEPWLDVDSDPWKFKIG